MAARLLFVSSNTRVAIKLAGEELEACRQKINDSRHWDLETDTSGRSRSVPSSARAEANDGNAEGPVGNRHNRGSADGNATSRPDQMKFWQDD